jgi:hypothetical protein
MTTTTSATAANEIGRQLERDSQMQAQANEQQQGHTQADFARRLREETAAVRFRRRELGNSRTLDSTKRQEIANLYDADPDYVRARKVLLNRKDTRIRECFAICDRAIQYWESMTVPYSEAQKGVRLIRRDRIREFEAGIQRLLDELSTATAAAETVYHSEILPEARTRLEQLFDPADYPATLIGCWGFDWEYPSIEPPNYLAQLNPELYRAEQDRIRRRFEEAVRLAEQSFLQEFSQMIGRLAERLQPGPDGKAKKFQDTSVQNLRDFFDRFRQLNIGSNDQLDALVQDAQRALKGVEPQSLRKDVQQRQTVGESMQQIFGRLTEMLVDKPARKITLEESDD